MTDVLIVGAGIIGAASAWRLAQAGFNVTILDRSAPGSEASQAALGVLSFHGRPDTMPKPLRVLAQKSRDFYPAIIQELQEAVGEHVYFRQEGQLILAFNDDDLASLEGTLRVNREEGVELEEASIEEALMLEPNLNPEIAGALYSPNDAWVDNTALTQAFVRAAHQSGATFEQAEVTSVESRSGRVTGVNAGETLYEADWVVLAAGAWSGQIWNVPVKPRRGQAYSVEGSYFKHVIHSPRGYIVPKGDTQTMLGATVEDVGFDLSNTPEGLGTVSRRAFEISPVLETSTFAGAWAGLRPGTPDDLPLIGPSAELPNLVIATGHFRNGILLAPITADLVRQIVAGETPELNLLPYSPDRDSLKV
ncbi:MAG: glycine oxidase ThiO [Anaerolineae bacterium]|nr:MAG: glycine oxidase ThiO [Anaerolineae bacterium]